MFISPSTLTGQPVLAQHFATTQSACAGIRQGGDAFVAGFQNLTNNIKEPEMKKVADALRALPENEMGDSEIGEDVADIEFEPDKDGYSVISSGDKGLVTYTVGKNVVAHVGCALTFHKDSALKTEDDSPPLLGASVDFNSGVASRVEFDLENWSCSAVQNLAAFLVDLVNGTSAQDRHLIEMGWRNFLEGAAEGKAYFEIASQGFGSGATLLVKRSGNDQQPARVPLLSVTANSRVATETFKFSAKSFDEDETVNLKFVSNQAEAATQRFAQFFKVVLEGLG